MEQGQGVALSTDSSQNCESEESDLGLHSTCCKGEAVLCQVQGEEPTPHTCILPNATSQYFIFNCAALIEHILYTFDATYLESCPAPYTTLRSGVQLERGSDPAGDEKVAASYFDLRYEIG